MPIDPRAYSKEKLPFPEPLPCISRKALKRVKDPLPVPTLCRYCKAPVKIARHAEIYGGREYGDWPFVYLCTNSDCGAYVGIHDGTDIPVGTLADRPLRVARKYSKGQFYKLMRQQDWSRDKAYEWLAKHMGLPVEETHFGWFDLDQCGKAGDLCAACLGE